MRLRAGKHLSICNWDSVSLFCKYGQRSRNEWQKIENEENNGIAPSLCPREERDLGELCMQIIVDTIVEQIMDICVYKYNI